VSAHDRRYSTAAWQRLRRAVLARDGYVCQVQGPRCTGIADTVDHVLPSSTHPHLFWAEENLRASCRRCNFGRGNRAAAAKQRQTIADLRALVEQQQQTIDRLLERLARYERVDGRSAEPPMPAIY
jgi:5-methylcytosine-specific restriction endonuclease McrA